VANTTGAFRVRWYTTASVLGYTPCRRYILLRVAKHLIDLDEKALGAARAELGTTTIKDTVNEALRLATGTRQHEVATALDALAGAELADRADAWR
jgi:Arc/MetJ family transcription regulator